METHEDTRAHLSSKIIQQYADGKRDKRKISEFFKGFWSNPVVKDEMAKRVAEVNRSYFIQRDKTTSDIVCVWDGINQIKAANPQWKWQNIYAACNGSKPSYLGFKWERSSEIPEGCEHLVHRGENVLFKDVDKTHLPRTNSLVYTVHHGEFKGEYTGVELSKIYAAMYNAFCKAKCNEIYWKRGKTKITRG
jgi:hypothetical protein